MSTATLSPAMPQLSANDFLQMHGDERGVELIRGIVRRKAMPGARHGLVCQRTSFRIGLYLQSHDIGYLFTHDTFVRTEQYPASYRGPDLQFMSYSRMPKGTVPSGIPDVAPEMVIEVRSTSDSWKAMTRKALEYLDADVKVVVLIDPEDQTATLFRPDGKPQTIGIDGTLTVPELLPGFSVPMKQIFE